MDASTSGNVTSILIAIAAVAGILLSRSTDQDGSGNSRSVLIAILASVGVLLLSRFTGLNTIYLFLYLIIGALFMGLASMLEVNNSYTMIGFLTAFLFIGLGWYVLFARSGTMPNISPFEDMEEKEEEQMDEGFYGGVAVGAGVPDCLRTSSEGAQLHALFASKKTAYDEGKADFQELTLLLSQLSCFKKDLMGVAKQVEATRYQPFATQLDMEPIAETTARCFAKTIPPRDLELSFDKWSKRGIFLITRLCTAANLTETEVKQAEKLFHKFIADIKDVAQDACLTGTPTILAEPQGSPRDAKAYDPGSSGREYFGLY